MGTPLLAVVGALAVSAAPVLVTSSSYAAPAPAPAAAVPSRDASAGPGAVAATGGPPSPTGSLVGSWQFNGAASSTSEPDSSGSGNTATPDPRHAGITWGGYEPASDSGWAHFADGILQAPSNPTLEPGNRNIRLDLRLRVTNGAKGANFIQKGTSADKSGFWKIEMTRYIVRCRFIGTSGSARLQSHALVGDGRWHTITCTKTASAADLWMDGSLESHQNVVVGTNTNTTDAVSIGGKTIRGAVSPDDELGGDLDYATYRLG
ncbi:MAG: LamG domain-containing protein [Actinomycetota bacterium]|nr:LamG domain-containing protein [Actinomycetota bacterium]